MFIQSELLIHFSLILCYCVSSSWFWYSFWCLW